MNHISLIAQLDRNNGIFHVLFSEAKKDFQTWRFHPEKWCLKEILFHLIDEEREDFRARVRHCLETPELPMPPIDPQAWAMERNYMGRKFMEGCNELWNEREASVKWLASLGDVNWKSVHHHPKLGAMSAEKFLANWVEHDLLHIRQVLNLQHHYLAHTTMQDLSYAGNW